MTRKRPSLFSAEASTTLPARPTAAVATLEPVSLTKRAEASGRPPSRQGKRIVSVYVEPEAAKQLGIMAIKEDSSIQALMIEALNDLFAKRGVNRIA